MGTYGGRLDNMIRSGFWALFVVIIVISPNQTSAGSGANIPNVSLEVTVKQKEHGSVGKGLHVAHLLCW